MISHGTYTGKVFKSSQTRLEASRRYYAKNKDKYKQWAKLRVEVIRSKDPELLKTLRKRNERRFNATTRGIWHILKSNSKTRKREFTLDYVLFDSWYTSQSKVCTYCGLVEGSNRLEIDRKDNSIGYTIENIVLACRDCNDVKGRVLSFEEMKIVGEIVMKKRI